MGTSLKSCMWLKMVPRVNADSKSAKNQISVCPVWRGGGGGGGGVSVTKLQLVMLSPNLRKSYVEGFAKNFLSFWAKSIPIPFVVAENIIDISVSRGGEWRVILELYSETVHTIA